MKIWLLTVLLSLPALADSRPTESADSLVRVDFTTDYDQDDGNNNNIRLRRKLYLPKVSRRLNRVFSDEQ